MDTFGDRLRAARKAGTLTQDELADLIEVTKSAVSGWENNRELPGFDKLLKLRAALRVSLDSLVCGIADPRHDREPDRNAVADHAPPIYADSPMDALSRDQRKLIESFERLSDRKRKALLQLLAE
ncbi:MAG: helix-turn-helix domain-containing protein [Lysobacter sp.]